LNGDQKNGLTGRTLGSYEIGRLIGKGGGGAVYLARSVEPGPAGEAGSVVAVKVFHPELIADENIFQRFQREAELGMKIRHRHIVQTYELGCEEVDGTAQHFLAMEFVEGETLRETLAELRVLPEHLLLQVADQVLDALAAVHAEGMIHRDIKPENIVLTRDQHVRVMDLGVARLQQEGRDLTRAGEFVGSVSYAAPEQFMDQDHVDTRSDIYAFGVMLYELATGQNPFDEAELSALLRNKLSGRLRRPKSVNRDLAPFLDDVILTCAQSAPDARFASCEELRTILAEGESSAWWAGRIEGEAFPAATRALRQLRPPRDAPILGREAELERLHAAYERVRGGSGTVVFVGGAAGGGKSRLVHDFLEELVAPDGPYIWAGHCPDGEAPSCHAMVEAARGFFGEDRFEAAEDLEATYTEALRSHASKRPLVLALKDMHRADRETLDLFEHLALGLTNAPVLLVATYRQDELEEGSTLTALASSLAQRTEVETITLGPMDRDAADELIRGFVGQTRTARALSWPLYRASDGNPYFLIEILAYLKETGVLAEAPDGAGLEQTVPIDEVVLPPSVRALLELRLTKLDDDHRSLLEAAAVQGPEFDGTLLATVTGQKRIRMQKRLAVLERSHRLVVSSGRREFRFASHGLQRVVYQGVSDESRAHLHSLCADTIRDEESEWDDARAYSWVRHMLLAGRIADAGEGVMGAAEHVAAHHHSSEGAAFLSRLADALAPGEHRLRYTVLMRLASLQHRLGRLGEQGDALARALQEAESLGEAGLRARVRAALAGARWHAGDYDQAEQEATRGIALADEAGDLDGKARCLFTLGTVEFRRGEFAGSAEHLRAALELQRECGDRRGEAQTLLRLGSVMPEIGEGDRALETKQSALAILRDIGDRRGEGEALKHVGNAYVDVGRIPESHVCYERAIQIARDLGDLPAQASAWHRMACVYAMEGRIEDAKETFERALDVFRELGDASGEASVLDELGSALASLGDFTDALQCLEEALGAAERTGEAALLARVLRHLGTVHLERGDRDQAWQLYERALDLARSRTRCAILADMGRAAERDGDYDRAARFLQESLSEDAAPANRVLSLCRLARAQQAAGRLEEAVTNAHLAEELVKDECVVAPSHGPEVFFSLGTVLADHETGRGYLEKARDLVDARTRSIRSVVYRHHYLTTHWPNREILEQARQLESG
jgi:tetratricopeptide (TPR) repeat protein